MRAQPIMDVVILVTVYILKHNFVLNLSLLKGIPIFVVGYILSLNLVNLALQMGIPIICFVYMYQSEYNSGYVPHSSHQSKDLETRNLRLVYLFIFICFLVNLFKLWCFTNFFVGLTIFGIYEGDVAFFVFQPYRLVLRDS